MADLPESPPDDPTDRAEWLRAASERHYDAGRYAEALAASEDAVQIYRRLAQRWPEMYALELIDALKDMAVDLRALERRAAASVIQEEVVERYRALVDAGHALGPDLAEALGDYAAGLGHEDAAQAAAARAEAVELLRTLTAREPSGWSALAEALDRRAQDLTPGERRAMLEEAIALSRAHATDSADDQRTLADRLESLAFVEHHDGAHADAAALAAEAVEIHRSLAAEGETNACSALAVWLDTASDMLVAAGQPEQALVWIDEALAVFHRLLAADEGWLREMLICFEYRRDVLMTLGRPREALASAEEAVACGRRRLEVEAPVDFWVRAELHRAEQQRAAVLLALDRVDEAAAATDAAIDALWPSFVEDPAHASGWLGSTIAFRKTIPVDDGGRVERYAAVMARVDREREAGA